MGSYSDAYDRFRLMALGRFAGPPATPNLEAGYAASMLRYLKDRAALVAAPLPSWQGFGRDIALTKLNNKIPVPARDDLWEWAAAVCKAADATGLPFLAVTPQPAVDHALLRKLFDLDATPPKSTGPATTPGDDDDADAARITDELEAGAKKPDPSRSPGDQINLALFFIAAIVVASVFHRR